MNGFTTITTDRLRELISGARSRVGYVAPGLFTDVADAILCFVRRVEQASLAVVIDPDPEVCRLGYGQIEGLELLMAGNVKVRTSPGLRIGVLIVDSSAWIFSPTPLVVEAGPSDHSYNALEATLEQANSLFRSIESDAHGGYSNGSNPLPIEGGALDEEQLCEVRVSLRECPPQPFDLRRQVSVYQAYVQFVELRLHGCHLGRRTIAIPSKLLRLPSGAEVEDRLQTKFQLIQRDGQLSSKELEDQKRWLERTYLSPLGQRFGVVILRQHKQQFMREVQELQCKVAHFRKKVTADLDKELRVCQEMLVEAFLGAVTANPPDDLRYRIATEKPSEGQARHYLCLELERVIPTSASLIREMRLDCDFKDITYEMLNDPEFTDALMKAYPCEDWPKTYREEVTLGTACRSGW